MDAKQIIEALNGYEAELAGILSRFTKTRDSLHIHPGDDALLRRYVREMADLLNDALGKNNYSAAIIDDFNYGTANMYNSPSYNCVENILGTIRAALTRFNRSPELLERRAVLESRRQRQNIFIIHGHNEAKWRELKDILFTQFGLNPIVLSEQPDAGCNTLIEKFEHYAETCSYAIAVFTPDDVVGSEQQAYLQARPNVIYELGWFCGKLGRGGAMLLLKEGTTLFSDFGGILQKRFRENISEQVVAIRRDLISAGILADV